MKIFSWRKPKNGLKVLILFLLLIAISLRVTIILMRPKDLFKDNEHFKMDSLDNPHTNMIIQ